MCPGALRSSRVVAGTSTRTRTGCYMRRLPGCFARAPSVLRPSSSSSSSLSNSPSCSCLPRFKCLEISCGPSFCPGSSASFHSATGSLARCPWP
ncbi:hypothetical protein V8C26DRAFT_413047 [Trichoderma gracile]